MAMRTRISAISFLKILFIFLLCCLLFCSPVFAQQVTYVPFNGGSAKTSIGASAVDAFGNVYLTGQTNSTDFPVTANAFQTINNNTSGGDNGFVSIINISSGTAVLVYSTYLGGSNNGLVHGIAVDSAGMIYICGNTQSTNFPITANAFQTTLQVSRGHVNAFLSKINPSLSGVSSLLYSTYLGGTVEDEGDAVALDSAGNAYVTGYTESPNFPVTSNAFSTTLLGGSGGNAFLSEINTNLSGTSSLIYSTFLGGRVQDSGNGVAIDPEGNACITGFTESSNFPVTSNAFSTGLTGIENVFISKINTSLSGASSLIYSSFLGGSYADAGEWITIDTAGFIYITGYTESSDFPVTSGAFQTINNSTTSGGGDGNAFLTKMDINSFSTTALLYSTFLGGSGDKNGDGDVSWGIVVDTSGNAYISGFTSSTDFPVTPDAVVTVDPYWADDGADFFSAINTNSSGTASWSIPLIYGQT
jgi:hypothetical protein